MWILLSLLIVALVAGVAIPAWFSRHDVTLDNAAVLLARDLRATQNRAAYLGIEARMEFDEDGWKSFDQQDEPLARVGGSKEMIERSFSVDAVFRGVELSGIHLGGDRSIHFGPMGQALEAGSFTLTFRDEERTVRVAADSGLVEIEGLARPWADDGR